MSSPRHRSRRYECAPAGRVAFVILLATTSGLAACAPLNELRDALSQWFSLEKFPGLPPPVGEELPEPAPTISTERLLKKEASKASKKVAKQPQATQRPQFVSAPKKPFGF